jgi:hypothetical protein
MVYSGYIGKATSLGRRISRLQGNAPNPSLPFCLHLLNVEMDLSVMAEKTQHVCRQLRLCEQIGLPRYVTPAAFKR